MKTLFSNFHWIALAVLILASRPSAALIGDARLIKSEDNRIAYCSKPSDLTRIGYRPIFWNVSSEKQEVSAQISVAAVVCRKTDGAYKFEARSFTAPVIVRAGENGGHQSLSFKEMKLVWANSNDYVLAQISAEDTSMQVFQFKSMLSQLLTGRERKRFLEGASIAVKTKLYLRGKVSRAPHGFVAPMNFETGGKYELSFVVSQDPETKQPLITNSDLN